ncbi:MAG: hypothetical protein IH590_11735 [Aquamicrobium sp.]|nr:hypothetical protein [Aquamicrobium sp.]
MNHRRGDLNDMARRQTDDYLRRSSITYLECCISLMLTHMSREQAAEILERQARLVRELG